MDPVLYISIMSLVILGTICVAIAWHCTAQHIDKMFE